MRNGIDAWIRKPNVTAALCLHPESPASLLYHSSPNPRHDPATRCSSRTFLRPATLR